MKDLKIKTKVVHSLSKDAWNIVSTTLTSKYKIARIPYIVLEHNDELNIKYKNEAKDIAEFISLSFNMSSKILESILDLDKFIAESDAEFNHLLIDPTIWSFSNLLWSLDRNGCWIDTEYFEPQFTGKHQIIFKYGGKIYLSEGDQNSKIIS